MTEAELIAHKRTLAPAVLQIDGVSGLGVGVGGLNVYLERDDPGIRAQVEKTAKGLTPDAPLSFVVSGAFRPQGEP